MNYCCGMTKKGSICRRHTTKNIQSYYCSSHISQSIALEFIFIEPSLENEVCPVCFELIKNQLNPLECGHWIHYECLIEWGYPICPLCRKELEKLPLTV